VNLILHLGLGAFHRAHQAVFLQRLHDSGEDDWAIVGANLRDDQRQVEEALAQQGGAYTLETAAPDGTLEYETIRSIRRVIPYKPDLGALIEAGADPRTRILSMTVTEGGYESGAPLYPALRAILAARRSGDSGPVTLLSCDNVRANGARLRRGLLAYLAAQRDKHLSNWLETNASFPGSMVDRITPQGGPGLAERVRAATGRDDRAPVRSELHLQWVLQDRFCNGRPAWEKAGVQFADDVSAYEEAKIRMLNASHSILAWSGAMLGLRYIHEAAAVSAIDALARDFLAVDVAPCLASTGIDLPAYGAAILERFSNAHLGDTIERVASESATKARTFILPTLLDLLRRNAPLANTGAIAGRYFRYLEAARRGALPFAYRDELLGREELAQLFASPDPAATFSADPRIWGEAAGHPLFASAVRDAIARHALI
jgi:D-arabinitol 4-dehydrogenase